MKPLTEAEKAKCVFWMHEFKSPTVVKRKFRNFYNTKNSPTSRSIRKWYEEFKEVGHMKGKSTGRKPLGEIVVRNVNNQSEEFPKSSIRQWELNMPYVSVQRTLRKSLKFWPYKIKFVHAMKPQDPPARQRFAETILNKIARNKHYLKKICFSDEATFHVSGVVNRHNVRIWGTDNPREYLEEEANSPKVNVWCGLLHNKVIGPFFFAGQTVTQYSYLDMLEGFAYPQLANVQGVIFQQDGAPPHWALRVRRSLNEHFPNRWIGRDGPIPWPARSPDVTPLDFFFWGFVKGRVFKTPVHDIEDLKQRIREATEEVNINMLTNTWKELLRRLKFLRENNGIHIEVYK